MSDTKKEKLARQIAKAIVNLDSGQISKEILRQAMESGDNSPQSFARGITWIIADLAATTRAIACILPQELRQTLIIDMVEEAMTSAQKETGHLGLLGQNIDFDFSGHTSFADWKKGRSNE